eukprot:CAMPEP_0203909656 /NCGR_PEP_ID=MMETSP0359-20131031/50942_1 /ASSEMBLY_ACC=CAM_ASM_000338 /TAXON_ID=268821 /ORGANISM="Scrippsiella Hangoei, Strain SHTV-5" /LENGTH=149 /DNA_ID=CAMNT_0050834941 /DNA_START=84 /DNA_END=529 /DNA_ORIENTATION=+
MALLHGAKEVSRALGLGRRWPRRPARAVARLTRRSATFLKGRSRRLHGVFQEVRALRKEAEELRLEALAHLVALKNHGQVFVERSGTALAQMEHAVFEASTLTSRLTRDGADSGDEAQCGGFGLAAGRGASFTPAPGTPESRGGRSRPA